MARKDQRTVTFNIPEYEEIKRVRKKYKISSIAEVLRQGLELFKKNEEKKRR